MKRIILAAAIAVMALGFSAEPVEAGRCQVPGIREKVVIKGKCLDKEWNRMFKRCAIEPERGDRFYNWCHRKGVSWN